MRRASMCCSSSRHMAAAMWAAVRRHSTGSGMQPLETSALQAGLKTMPLRIPPLPEVPPEEVLRSFSPITQDHGILLPCVPCQDRDYFLTTVSVTAKYFYDSLL